MAIVSKPVIIQDTSSHPALPTSRDISAATIKMPVPIIEPATIMVESKSPRLRLSASCRTSLMAPVLTAGVWDGCI